VACKRTLSRANFHNHIAGGQRKAFRNFAEDVFIAQKILAQGFYRSEHAIVCFRHFFWRKYILNTFI
jgi:hypothetical protein